MIVHLVIVLLIFIVVSTAHELSHFFSLRFFGLPVYRLSFGFGPVLFRKALTNGPVQEISFKLLPFTLGTSFDVDNPKFLRLSHWSKIIIFASGSFCNFVLAFIASLFIDYGSALKPSSIPNDLEDITRIFIVLNLLLAIFNLFPLSRFDGGYIFDSIVAKYGARWPHRAIQDVKIITTALLALLVFYLYRFWI